MNESGATAFEVREMAARIRLDGAQIPLGKVNENTYRVMFGKSTPFETAILVEALTLLAEQKEGERAAHP